MKDEIVITSNNEVITKPSPVRRSLDYHGIARRALNSKIEYDRDIDMENIKLHER